MSNRDTPTSLEISKVNSVVSSLKFKLKILESNYLNFIDNTISIFLSNKTALEKKITDQSGIAPILKRIEKNLVHFEQTKCEASSSFKGVLGDLPLGKFTSIVTSQLLQTEEELIDTLKQRNEAGEIQQIFETVYDCFNDLTQWHKNEKAALTKKWKGKVSKLQENNRKLIKNYSNILKEKHKEYTIATAKLTLENTTLLNKLKHGKGDRFIEANTKQGARPRSVCNERSPKGIGNKIPKQNSLHSGMEKDSELSSEYIVNLKLQVSLLRKNLEKSEKENDYLKTLRETPGLQDKYAMEKTINVLQTKIGALIEGIQGFMAANDNLRNGHSHSYDSFSFQEQKSKLEETISEIRNILPKRRRIAQKHLRRMSIDYKNSEDTDEINELENELSREKIERKNLEIEYLNKFDQLEIKIESLKQKNSNSLETQLQGLRYENEELKAKMLDSRKKDRFQFKEILENIVFTPLCNMENEVKRYIHHTETRIVTVLKHIDILTNNVKMLKIDRTILKEKNQTQRASFLNECSVLEDESKQLKKLVTGSQEARLDAMNTFKTQSEHLNEQINNHSKKILSKLSNLETAVSQFEALKQQYVQLNTDTEHLRDTLARMSEKKTAYKAKIHELTEVNSVGKAEFSNELLECREQFIKETAELELMISKLKDDNTKLIELAEESAGSHRVELEEKSIQTQQLDSFIEKLQKKYAKSTQKVAEMTEALDYTQKTRDEFIESLKRNTENLKTSLIEAESQLEKSGTSLDSAVAGKLALEDRVKALGAELATSNSKLIDLRSETDDLKSNLAENQDQIVALLNTNTKLTDKLENTANSDETNSKLLAAVEGELHELTEKYSQATRTIKDITNLLDSTRENKDEAIDSLEGRVRDLDDSVKEAHQQVETLQLSLELAANKEQSQENEVKELAKEISNKDLELLALTAELHTVQSSLTQSENLITSLQAGNTENALTSCIQQLRQELTLSQQERQELTQTYRTSIETVKPELECSIQTLSDSLETHLTHIESRLSSLASSSLSLKSSYLRELRITQNSLSLALCTLQESEAILGVHFQGSLPASLAALVECVNSREDFNIQECLMSEDSLSMIQSFEGLEDESRKVIQKHEQQINHLKNYIRDLDADLQRAQKKDVEGVNLEHLGEVLGKLLKIVPRLTAEGESMVKILLTMLSFTKGQVRDIERVRSELSKGKSTIFSILGIE